MFVSFGKISGHMKFHDFLLAFKIVQSIVNRDILMTVLKIRAIKKFNDNFNSKKYAY